MSLISLPAIQRYWASSLLPTSYFSEIHLNVILPSSSSLPADHFPQTYSLKFYAHFCHPNLSYMSSTLLFPWFHYPNNTRWTVLIDSEDLYHVILTVLGQIFFCVICFQTHNLLSSLSKEGKYMVKKYKE